MSNDSNKKLPYVLTNQSYVSHYVNDTPLEQENCRLKHLLEVQNTRLRFQKSQQCNTVTDLHNRIKQLEQQLMQKQNQLMQNDTSLLLKNAETEYRLRLQSINKQYTLKMQKQQELHQLEIWRLKQDLETLSQQAGNSGKSSQTYIRFEENSNCNLCSNGEIIRSMQKILQNLSKDHDGCLADKRATTLQTSQLDQQLKQLKQSFQEQKRQKQHYKQTAQEFSNRVKEMQQEISCLRESLRQRQTEHNYSFTRTRQLNKISPNQIRLPTKSPLRNIKHQQQTMPRNYPSFGEKQNIQYKPKNQGRKNDCEGDHLVTSSKQSSVQTFRPSSNIRRTAYKYNLE